MGVGLINAYRVLINSHVASHCVIFIVHCVLPTNANFYNNRCCTCDVRCCVLMCDWDYEIISCRPNQGLVSGSGNSIFLSRVVRLPKERRTTLSSGSVNNLLFLYSNM